MCESIGTKTLANLSTEHLAKMGEHLGQIWVSVLLGQVVDEQVAAVRAQQRVL